MDLQLEGTVAIVTGASRGLGEAAARALVAEGAKVVVAARSLDDLEALASENPDAYEVAQCDMADRTAVEGLVDVAVDRFGRLDAIVNNAGIAPGGKFIEQGIDLMERVIAINLLAPAALARAAAMHWIEAGKPGSVINIASTSATKGKPMLAAYSSSKGGLLRFTEALSGEWAKHKIRVNVIAPGAFETAAQDAVVSDPKFLEARLKKIPARRMGRPEEIGPLVCYLASPLSEFATGSCFVIDGGEVAKL